MCVCARARVCVCVCGIHKPHSGRNLSPPLAGRNQESWALDLELEDMKLLCPDGGEASPFEHKRCHLAVVPTNAVVVRAEDKCRVYKFLERVQVRMGGRGGRGGGAVTETKIIY